MSKIKAIIFDFDGVLVESMDIKARAFAFLFRDHPEHVDEIVKLHMQHGGTSRFVKFEMIHKEILRRPLSTEQKLELGKQFSDYVYQEVIKCPFVAGAHEFLRKYNNELSLFVVSGTPQEEIRSIVKKRELDRYFREVFGAPEKKRSLNLRILNDYDLRPKETIFVGDSIDDWDGVKDTGIRFIGRVLKDNPFEGLKVDALINDLFDLEKVLDG